ncbi:reverse transcriptase domain, Reverse transcriptase zinc-binding domain protein [Artemisia annua]|uniref:Reverse transcriptase domain, Reverse transcriptase zinc-binding domain protein n=1 Tax=Artemisia annua TaxID=35608 RepID=A0A2U1NLV9_ARTAN|nr:reverse transcriptase domain, Reverse transcriptase zinc-binding domain protein [Artemisia annua]
MKCVFCKSEKDSHSHLFFSSPFSRRLWERLKGMAMLNNISNTWDEIISSISNRPARNSIRSVIQRLVLGASVYFVWQERNLRSFGDSSRSEDELFRTIVDTVRLRIMGLKIKVSKDVLHAAEVWNFPVEKRIKYKDILDEILRDDMDMDGEGQTRVKSHNSVSDGL